MSNFMLIFLCFGLGILFRRLKVFPESAPQVLNRFVIYISLPALTLSQIHRLSLQGNVWVPVSMAWLQYVLGFGFFYLLGRWLRIPKKSLGTLTLTASLGNTSFLGFPLLEALFGAGAISVGILCDQPGSFLVLGTLGILTAASFSGHHVSARMLLRKVFTFPPFLALIVALLLRPVEFHENVFAVLDRLGSTLVPLSLLSVGMQLHFHPDMIFPRLKLLGWGLGFKLLLSPLLLLGVYAGLGGQRGPVTLYTLIEAAMAPMITAGILATEYDLDTDLANLMVGLGIPLSLITVPLWSWALQGTGLLP
jgi:predicted permease